MKIFLFTIIAPLFITLGCSKNNNNKIIIPATDVDTMLLLKANKWVIGDIWIDNNNNGHLDSNETFPGSVYFTMFIFYENGVIFDSLPHGSRTGIWHFLGNSKSTLTEVWSSQDSNVFQILVITDTTLSLKRLYTPEEWHLKKYLY